MKRFLLLVLAVALYLTAAMLVGFGYERMPGELASHPEAPISGTIADRVTRAVDGHSLHHALPIVLADQGVY
jgi:hypothetical protein